MPRESVMTQIRLPPELKEEARWRLALRGETLTDVVTRTLRGVTRGKVRRPEGTRDEVVARLTRVLSRDPATLADAIARYDREFPPPQEP